MANKPTVNTKEEIGGNTTVKEARTAVKEAVEATYTVEELASGASRFGEKYEVVKAALITAGKEKATFKETEKAIKEFKERKVE